MSTSNRSETNLELTDMKRIGNENGGSNVTENVVNAVQVSDQGYKSKYRRCNFTYSRLCCAKCIFGFVMGFILLIGFCIAANYDNLTCYGTSGAQEFKNTLVVGSTIGPDVGGIGATIDGFNIIWTGKNIQVKKADTTLWSTRENLGFLSVSDGSFTAHGHDAAYDVHDYPSYRTSKQTVDSLQSIGDTVVLKGKLSHSDEAIDSKASTFNYVLKFYKSDLASTQLNFDVTVEYTNKVEVKDSKIRIFLTYESSTDEKFYGFGEQFTNTENSGNCVPIIVMENGVGRGLQPGTWILNTFAKGAGGSAQTTYTAVPHYLTSKLHSLYFDNTEFMVFNLKKVKSVGEVEVEIVTPDDVHTMRGRIIGGNNPMEILSSYTLYSGRMRPLPDWITTGGAVVGMQGGTDKVSTNLDMLLKNKVPVAALWLQDWTGKRETAIGARLWWNWKVNLDWYHGWYEFVDRLAKEKQIRVMTYINPFLAILPEADASKKINYFEMAKKMDCLVKRNNNKVVVEASATPEFLFGSIDFRIPKCMEFYKNIIQDNMLHVTRDNDGNVIPRSYGMYNSTFPASGWMADFAEYFPFDGSIEAGMSGMTFHNYYPVWWQRTCRAAVDEAGLKDEVVYFSRSGAAKTPGATSLVWLGDQLPSWDVYDGMQSTLRATLSAGMSGYALMHSDIGGYTTVKQPPFPEYVRDPELLTRWMEMSSVSDAIFRTHEGLKPKVMTQVYSNDEIALTFAKFTNIHSALGLYRRHLMDTDLVKTGSPLARHMIFHYLDDDKVHELHDQFLLGSEFLMAPVFTPKTDTVRVYLPKESTPWIHLFSAKSYTGGDFYQVDAPLSTPAIFYKQGSQWAKIVITNLIARGVNVANFVEIKVLF